MSLETNSWTALSKDQAAFFNGQVEAARQTAFSPTAHQAGITALNATRFSFNNNRSSQADGVAILWPDPYVRDGVCMVAASGPTSNIQSSFMRIARQPTAYMVEGVALNLHYGNGGHLYGRQIIQRHEVDANEVSTPRLGMQFLDEAMKHSKQIDSVPKHPSIAPNFELTGIEDQAVGRLFQSLSSLAMNTVTAGVMAEKETSSRQTYDLAHTLLKIAASDPADGDIRLGDGSGYARGAVFDTPEGIAVIRRLGNIYPDTLGLTLVGRPTTTEDTIFLNHYNIQSSAVIANMATLPIENYDSRIITQASIDMDTTPHNMEDPNELVYLGNKARRALEQQITGLITYRINARAE